MSNEERSAFDAPLKIDWLKLEKEIRQQLRTFREENQTPEDALEAISEAVGYHTGRGYEL